MRRAIFGGSFNPIHNDHIRLAVAFADEFDLDRVTLIPTNTTPLKDNSAIVSGEHRLAMCRLAVMDNPLFEVSDIEVKRGGISYTSDTIAALKSDGDELFLIVGADMYVTLDRWHDFRYIFDNATILVAPRDMLDYNSLLEKSKEFKACNCRTFVLSQPVGTLSSTAVRAAVKNGDSIAGMVDGRVEEYINTNRLYR